MRPAFVDAIGQQQRRVRPLFEVVDCPIEMHAAIKLAQFGGAVCAAEGHSGALRDLLVEIPERHARGPSSDDDLDKPGKTARKLAEDVEASLATDHAEPADPPRRTRRRLKFR